MTRWRAQAGRLAIIAVVAAMHVFFFRLLVVEFKPTFSPAEARLTVALIATPPHRAGRPRSASRGMASEEHRTLAGSKPSNAKRLLEQIRSQVAAPEALLRNPIDWEQALQRGAQDTISRSGKRRTLTFALPRSAISSLSDHDREWDGWDFAATHRVGPLPRGGTIIRLNAHCSIVLVPLPLFGCFPGKTEVNGDLFRGLPKSRSEESNTLP